MVSWDSRLEPLHDHASSRNNEWITDLNFVLMPGPTEQVITLSSLEKLNEVPDAEHDWHEINEGDLMTAFGVLMQWVSILSHFGLVNSIDSFLDENVVGECSSVVSLSR